MKNTNTFTSKRAFSITELLIAILIIMILASILVPNVSKYAEKSREAACRTDLENIAEAQSRVATDMGYYVRLYALNDTKSQLINEGNDTSLPADYDQVFIRINDHEIETASRCQDILDRLDTSATLVVDWAGPYITIQNDDAPGAAQEFLRMPDIPNDPWGNDYILILRTGVVQEDETGGEIETNLIVDDGAGGAITVDAENAFDRPVIYSLGPDGIPADPLGSTSGSSDDMWRKFGY